MLQGVGQIPADVAERHGLAAGEAPSGGCYTAHEAAVSAEELPVPVFCAPEDGDSPIMVLLTALTSIRGYATFFPCEAGFAQPVVHSPSTSAHAVHFGSCQPVPKNRRACRWMTSWQRTACGCWARMP